MKQDSEWQRRAEEFERRLKAAELSKSQFQARSGLSRNVIYNLSKGQAPSSQEQADAIDRAFREAGA